MINFFFFNLIWYVFHGRKPVNVLCRNVQYYDSTLHLMDDKTTFCIEIELLKYWNRILNEFRTIWAKIVNFKKKIESLEDYSWLTNNTVSLSLAMITLAPLQFTFVPAISRSTLALAILYFILLQNFYSLAILLFLFSLCYIRYWDLD